jgi:RHS repeat-associated protein
MSTAEGNVDEEAGFTGEDYDTDVEMTYFNARWYDPELGRFVEEDPMADDPNLYSYGFDVR